MRVLHCIPHLIHGGAQRQLALIAAEHARAGHDVHIALVYQGPNAALLHGTAARIHEVGNGNRRNPRIVLQLIRLVRTLQPDIVQTWLMPMDVVGGMAALAAGVPWILSERASRDAYEKSWRNRVRVAAGRRATAIVSNSEAGDLYWGALAPPSMRRFVVPNGVPLQEIAAAQPNRGHFEIPTGAPVILFVGRLVEQKNVLGLLRALPSVFTATTAHVVVVGDGPQRTDAVEAIERLRLSGRVHLAGFRSDVWNLMKGADVFVSPSFFEGHPNTVLEAMACGCAVVVSDIGEHREFLDESCARLVAPRDSTRLAEALVDTLAARDAARNRAGAALARVSQWSVARTARQYEDIYAAVAGARLISAGAVNQPAARRPADQTP